MNPLIDFNLMLAALNNYFHLICFLLILSDLNSVVINFIFPYCCFHKIYETIVFLQLNFL